MTADKQPYFVSTMPSYWWLELVRSDGEFKVCREPILGWEMRPGVDLPNVNYFAHPITLTWSPHRDAVIAILCPEGGVRLTNGTSFSAETEWLAHAADEARAREEAWTMAGCSHCRGPVGHLVRHDAHAGGTQVWLSCASCCARSGNALPHVEHPRLLSNPIWREDLSAEQAPEEIEDGWAARAAAPVRAMRCRTSNIRGCSPIPSGAKTSAEPAPEEIEEIVLASKPVALTELLRDSEGARSQTFAAPSI
jgi:hypothetical protein